MSAIPHNFQGKMKNKNNNQIDDYLGRIEAMERKERRKKVIYAIGLVLLAGGIYTATQFSGSIFGQSGMMTFGYAELDTDKVVQLIEQGEIPFAVYHQDIGRDTIQTEEDYMELVSTVSLMETQLDEELSSFVSDSEFAYAEEQTNSNEELEPLPVYFVDITGSRKTQEVLNFTIESYDPSTAYTLDLGNGERIRVRRTATYLYTQPGDYRLRLFASRRGFKTSVYTKRVSISGPGLPNAETQLTANEGASPAETLVDPSTLRTADEGLGDTANAAENDEILLASADNDLLPLTTSSFDLAEEEVESANEEAETATPTRTSIDFSKPLFTADIMPQYPGGRRAMNRFIGRNARYPDDAREEELEGQVFVRFVVEADGSLSNINVFRGLGHGCDEEAVRLVQSMPNWIPGEFDGRPVPVYKEIPISFRLIN